MAAHFKKLAAAAIQCAAIVVAPSHENWLGFLPWIFIVFGFLIVDIEKSGKIYPYESLSLKSFLSNRWIAFILIYMLWQSSFYIDV